MRCIFPTLLVAGWLSQKLAEDPAHLLPRNWRKADMAGLLVGSVI